MPQKGYGARVDRIQPPATPLALPQPLLRTLPRLCHRLEQRSPGGVALGLGLVLLLGPALAAPPASGGKGRGGTPPASANGKAKELVPQVNPTTQVGNEPGQVHRLTDQLNSLGAVNCLARAEKIARFLDPTNAAGSAVMPLGAYPHQKLVVANLAIPQAEGRDSLAIITLAPNQANGCGAAYQLMTVEPGSCAEALKARQAESQGSVPLGGRSLRIQRLSQDSVFIGWQLRGSCLIVKQQNLLSSAP